MQSRELILQRLKRMIPVPLANAVVESPREGPVAEAVMGDAGVVAVQLALHERLSGQL